MALNRHGLSYALYLLRCSADEPILFVSVTCLPEATSSPFSMLKSRRTTIFTPTLNARNVPHVPQVSTVSRAHIQNINNTKAHAQSSSTSQRPAPSASRTHTPPPPHLEIHFSHLPVEPWLRRLPTEAQGPWQSPPTAPGPLTTNRHLPHLATRCCPVAHPGPPGPRRMPRPAPPGSYEKPRKPPVQRQHGQGARRSCAKRASDLSNAGRYSPRQPAFLHADG